MRRAAASGWERDKTRASFETLQYDTVSLMMLSPVQKNRISGDKAAC